MTPYRIIWEIDIHAESPEEAANEARLIQLDPDSIATVFTVIDRETQESIDIDLQPEESK